MNKKNIKLILILILILSSIYSNAYNYLTTKKIHTKNTVLFVTFQNDSLSKNSEKIADYQSKIADFNKKKYYDAAIKYSTKFLESIKDNSDIIYVKFQLASLHYKKNDFTQTYIQLSTLENLVEDHRQYDYYEKLGKLYTDISEYQKALLYLNKALEFETKAGNDNAIIRIYRSLGELNNNTKNYELALSYYNKGLSLSKKSNNYREMSAAYNNITTIEILNKDYQAALSKLLESKSLIDKIGSDNLTKNSIDYNIASVQIALNNLDEAKQILNQVSTYCIKNNQDGLFSYCLVANAEINEKEGDLKLMVQNLKKALKITTELKNQNLMSEINLRLSNTFEKLNNYKNALKHYKSHKDLNDSISAKIKNKDIIALQTRLEVSKYKEDLQVQSQKIELLEIKSQKTTFIYTLLSLLILALLLLTIRQFNSLKLKKKNEAFLNEINTLKEENLKKEVDFKTNQVTDFAIQIQEQNGVLLKLKERLNEIIQNNRSQLVNEVTKEIKDLSYDIKTKIALNNEKVQLNSSIKETSESFLLNLKNQFPKLNDKEIKVCTLIRLNYNTKQIANQLGIAEHSIHNYRYNIRKKCELSKTDQLDEFLKNL